MTTTNPETAGVEPVARYKGVNTILAKHFAGFIPDVVERVTVGNAACKEIVAFLDAHPAPASNTTSVGEVIVCERTVGDDEMARIRQMLLESGRNPARRLPESRGPLMRAWQLVLILGLGLMILVAVNETKIASLAAIRSGSE